MKEEKKRLVISLFIVFIMVSSVIGYMFGSGGAEKYEYNDHSFIKRNNNEWLLKYNGENLIFNLFPEQVEDIEVNFDVSEALGGKAEIDTTFDPDDELAEAIALAQYTFSEVITKTSDSFVMVGMTEENEFDLPIINCEDATDKVPVLYFKKSDSTSVELEDNCIIIEAKSAIDILAVKDRILYGLLGIIS
jgi:hypothetical protein